jgi:hypothetical protein
LREVAQALNEHGYRAAGNMRRGAFTRDTVRDMLANRFYLGKLPVFEPGQSRRVREWVDGRQAALIDEATFESALAAVKGRGVAVRADRRNATVYSLTGLLRCMHCGERMRVAHNMHGRIRYHCRSKAQGLGCTGRGSFLDEYEQQIAADLAHFELPDDWKRFVVASAADLHQEGPDPEQRRRQLTGRLTRLREMYEWGDIERPEYQRHRDDIERELSELANDTGEANHLDVLAAYVESLPAAWADADQQQRNELLSAIYESIWVNGPVVEYVKPRPEMEPLFRSRVGAAQPVCELENECHTKCGRGDPDGIRTHDLHRDRAAC